MNEQENEILIISAEESGERLDKILAQRFADVKSRTYFQMLIEKQLVFVNGQPVKKREKLREGDEVEIQFILSPELDLTPEEIPLDILYEDDAIIAINKKAGMVVHPAAGNWSGTFVNALLFHCKALPSQDKIRPGIVHRLDKDTTGLLLAAKTSEAQVKLIEYFSKREIEKEYLAICLGNPGSLTISAPIGRHPTNRKKMAITSDKGKEAVTICETLHKNEKYALVKLKILTGRTHQIRVHMQSRNAPVLGDEIYGNDAANKRAGISRQLLHAWKLAFKHPISGKFLQLTAPIPKDMGELIEKFGWNLK